MASLQDFAAVISRSDLDLVKGFISENNPDLNPIDPNPSTPLILAVNTTNLPIVIHLVECGADVNLADRNGETPFTLACYKGEIDIVTFLVEKGADIRAKTKNGISGLLAALSGGHEHVIKHLLEFTEIDLHAVTGKGQNAFHLAKKVSILTLLYQRGVSMALRDNDGYSPLLLGVCSNYDKYRFISEKLENIDPNEANESGETALHICASNQYYLQDQIVSDYITRGAAVNLKDNSGLTPLHRCASNNHTKIATLLLASSSIDIDAVSSGSFENTPLSMACNNGHFEIVELLINSGANVNFTFASGSTVLDKANRSPSDILALLKRKGARSGGSRAAGYEEDAFDDARAVITSGLSRLPPTPPASKPKKACTIA